MKRSAGFSLIELMISLVLGLVISVAIIQTLVSSRVTNNLNQSMAQVQEGGRYIMSRLHRDLVAVGRYDMATVDLDTSQDVVVEAAFVNNRPVALAGDFAAANALGSTQGGGGANDELVVNVQALNDCTGSRYSYAQDVNFHAVNRYFVDGEELKCQGYDGRVVRGLINNAPATAAVTLLDNIVSFQVEYGISPPAGTGDVQATQYITADQIAAARANNQQVIAIRVAILTKGDANQVSLTSAPRYALLNEAAVTYDANHYYQVFTQTFALRNMKNFVRSI